MSLEDSRNLLYPRNMPGRPPFFHELNFETAYQGTAGSIPTLNPLYPRFDSNIPYYGVQNYHYRGPLPVSYELPFFSNSCPLPAEPPPGNRNTSGRVRNL
jgi:hypothetical protein